MFMIRMSFLLLAMLVAMPAPLSARQLPSLPQLPPPVPPRFFGTGDVRLATFNTGTPANTVVGIRVKR